MLQDDQQAPLLLASFPLASWLKEKDSIMRSDAADVSKALSIGRLPKLECCGMPEIQK